MKKLYNLLLKTFMVAAMVFGSQNASAGCKSVSGLDFNYSNAKDCKTYAFEGKVSTSGCLVYSWNIYSGNTLVKSNVGRTFSYTFANNGTYYTRLAIKDTCNNCDTVIYKTITVNCAAKCSWAGMDFNYSAKCKTFVFEGKNFNNGCLKYKFLFYNNSTGTSTYQLGRVNTYTFPSTGTYTVKMSVVDTCKNCDTLVYKTITIDCNPCDLKPDFSFKNDCRKVKFLASGNVSGATYYWYFGDASTGSGKDPSHTYVKDGVYKVCLLMVWKDANTGETCKKEVCKEVKVQCGKPCEIKGDYQFYTSGGTVKFFGSSNTGVYYTWDFGDGTTGSGKDIVHTYKKPGTYNVCVTITDKTRKCSVKICKKVVIEEPCRLKADFTWAKTSTGAIKFKAISSGGYYYEWSFGDGTYGSGVDPSHTFKPGTYNVCVTVYSKDKKCKVKICKTVVIAAEKCNWAKQGAGFSYSLNCPKLTLEAKNLGSECIKYGWGITPVGTNQTTTFYGRVQTITFSSNGTFNVCLKMYDSCRKCDTVICKTIEVKCPEKCNWAANKPSFYVWDSCKYLAGYIGFNSNISGCFKYTWKINGTAVSHDRYLKSFGITKNGTYEICVTVVDTCHGCDTTFCGTRTINCFSDRKCNWKAKYPNFTTFSIGSKCLSIEAGLNTSSAGCIRHYYSLAGSPAGYDGKTYHSWTVGKAGTYVVCLKLVDTCTGCDTTICREVTVASCCNFSGTDFTITNNASKCMYTFTGSASNNGCLKYNYTISNNGGSSYTNLGNGRVIDYQMKANGTYSVCLKVTDTCKKCDTTICKTFKVDCACSAKASFTVDSITTAGIAYIKNTSTGASYYSWDFGDSSSSTSSAPGKHAYNASGGYTICLTVWDANKTCSTKYCVTIKVVKTRNAASTENIKVTVPVNIYPNPASGNFTITTMGSANYQVLDMQGRVITSGSLINSTQINAATWMDGVYLVRITTPEGTGTTRVVVQK